MRANYKLLFLLIASLVSLCGCCAKPHTNDISGKIYYVPDFYNASFSWYQEGYDNVYIWNGKKVGKNQDGFEVVLSKLKSLPRKSRVIVYSTERFALESMIKGENPFRDFELLEKHFSQQTLDKIENNQGIINIVKRRQLTLVLSWATFKF